MNVADQYVYLWQDFSAAIFQPKLWRFLGKGPGKSLPKWKIQVPRILQRWTERPAACLVCLTRKKLRLWIWSEVPRTSVSWARRLPRCQANRSAKKWKNSRSGAISKSFGFSIPYSRWPCLCSWVVSFWPPYRRFCGVWYRPGRCLKVSSAALQDWHGS